MNMSVKDPYIKHIGDESSLMIDHHHLLNESANEGKIKERRSNARISFEVYEHQNIARSKSVMNKGGKRRSTVRSSLVRDAKDYYRDYDDKVGSNHDSVQILTNDDLVGECYVGFSKLMQSELRKQEKRNSTIL